MHRLSVLVLVTALTPGLTAAALTRPALSYANTFGGSGADYGTAVAPDSAGNVYLVGMTTSPDLPVKNALQPHLGGPTLRASTDFGTTWTGMPFPEGAYAVAGAAKTPGVLYAGGDGRVYRSDNSGKSWVALPNAPQGVVNALIVDANNPAVIYAGTQRGVFKSTDNGNTWVQADPGRWQVLDLVANPMRPSTIYAGIFLYPQFDDSGKPVPQPSIYRSTDAGATWVPLAGLADPVMALACDPSNPDVLYATANPGGFAFGTPAQTSIYKTTDGGNTWTKLAAMPVAGSTFALAAGGGAVFAATVNGVMRSRDGGVTWTATPVTAGADNVAVDPSNPQIVYASAGGILVSRDGGTTWKLTLPVRQNVQTIVAPPGDPGLVFVGSVPGQNIFVTKWSGDGKQMFYATYLGGSYYDVPTGIAVDRQGNAYVTGYTYATDFPVTAGALQTGTTAAAAGFVAKISPDGGTLVYSTYLGGSTEDAAFGIAVDGAGNAYLTGYAGSTDFPATAGAYQSSLRTKCSAKTLSTEMGDAFVTKLSADARSLVYSTLLGGSCGEQGSGIAVDGNGAATVVGATESSDFPVTSGAYIGKWPGAASGFVARLSPQGSTLLASSYVADVGTMNADAVALDVSGSAYMTGCADGGLGPAYIVSTLVGPSLPQPGVSGTCQGSAYVLKLNPALSSQVYLNYIGGRWGEGGAIAVAPSGNVWVAGYEDPFDNPGFPTLHPFQAGVGQGFVSQWSADGAAMLFSSQIVSALGMALDGSGNVFLTGFTNPPDKRLSSALLVKISDGANGNVTVEQPQRITPHDWGLAAPDLGVAGGEILVIPGTGLGPAQKIDAQIGSDGKIATTLGGTSVWFDDFKAPLLSAQSEQIVCVVPFEVSQNQDYTITMHVEASAGLSNAIRMPVADTAIEALAAVNQDGTSNTADHPGTAGSIATIFAAGYGQTLPFSVDGEINGAAPKAPVFGSIAVTIADDSGNQWNPDILYAGSAPGQVAGIMQINFRLPQLEPGSYSVTLGLADYYGAELEVVTWYVGK